MRAATRRVALEAFLISTGVVALGEMGDKTQLLAFLLAAKFKRPVPIVLGILVATLANHFLAGAVGSWVAAQLGPQVLRWVIGIAFVAMAGWLLIPDKIDAGGVDDTQRLGVFAATLVAVVAGTTLGMMIADVPAVFLGDTLAKRVPIRLVHAVAAFIFAVLGVLVLLGVGSPAELLQAAAA